MELLSVIRLAIGGLISGGYEMAGDEAFLCDDGKGNGCGRIFDGVAVKQVCGLCEGCAADLPDDEGC